jgi:hypothetical protein
MPNRIGKINESDPVPSFCGLLSWRRRGRNHARIDRKKEKMNAGPLGEMFSIPDLDLTMI